MARLDNWQNNLSALIEAKRNEPFIFKTHNCLLWVLSAVEACTGKDLAEPYRGNYTTEKSAARLLRKIDKADSCLAMLQKHLGELKPIAFARAGDIVILDPSKSDLELPTDTNLFGLVPGVCYGVVSYFVGEHGLIEYETLRLEGALWVS